MKMITKWIFYSKVMVWWLLLLPLSGATLCRPGHQYWDEALEKCINCSRCPQIGHVVLRPCQVHQDTKCGPLSALDIDWSFLGRPRSTKAPGSSHSHHKHISGNKHRELFFEEGHFHLNRDDTDKQNISRENKRLPRKEFQGEGNSSEDTETFLTHRKKNSHPRFISSEEREVRGYRKSHNKKWSSEEISSLNTDDTPKKHHKHHHYHKKHSSSETYSSNPIKHHSHNKNKTKNHRHHQNSKWSSSEIVHSFEFPDTSNSSELYLEDGHRWSFSETASSIDESSSFKKSNSTRKHHTHHLHPSMKRTNTSEANKHHGKKQKLQNFQEERDKILVQRPESASQLKESETGANSSFDGDVQGLGVQTDESPVLPKHFHKVNSPPSVSSAPFSATEEIIWDWQAIALALAVFACLLFFVVACVYSVHHARQWRRLKDHFEDFEADVGELSTRLSLLLPAIHPDDGGTGPVQADCCNNSSQCVYLEQLLARKRQTDEGGEHGNVYIDRDVANGHRV